MQPSLDDNYVCPGDLSGRDYTNLCKGGGMMTRLLFTLVVLLPVAAWAGATKPSYSQTAPAKADPATLCEAAANSAEYTERLPPRLLQAIGMTETGRLDPATGRLRPWPWSIDVDGDGQFFETRDEAIAAVEAAQARSVKSIDVGCNPVNLMFHPDAFASLQEAFDPVSNARFAARFLNTLYAGSHDWSRAIAAYHSETPALGDAYRVLVLARWQNPDLHVPTEPAAVSPYQAFLPASQVYGAFQSPSRVYGAFNNDR